MKTIIFFDLDGTIYNTKEKLIPSETVKLIKELSVLPNFYLGLATGRNVAKSEIIKEILPHFTYFVYLNGGLGYKKNEKLVDLPIEFSDLMHVHDEALKNEAIIGFVGSHEEYISKLTLDVIEEIRDYMVALPTPIGKISKDLSVYQLWLSSKDKHNIGKLLKGTNLKSYNWHSGGADILRSDVNKGFTIKQLLKDESNYQLIAIGDGENDLSMINAADIGIAMGNSGFLELKKKASYIAPNIEDNQLYDFFKNLVSFETND